MKFTRSWLFVFDVLFVLAAFVLAFAIRIDLRGLSSWLPKYWDLLLPFLTLRVVLLALFGLYRPIWARAAFREFIMVTVAVTLGSILATLLLVLRTLESPIEVFPRAVLAIEWVLTLGLLTGTRYSLRVLDLRHMEPEPTREEREHEQVLRTRVREWLQGAPADVRALWAEAHRWGGRRAAKRTFDIVAALVALLVFSPLLLVIAALVKLETHGPLLADTPKRAGRFGTQFRMYKFRSMYPNAHMMLVNDPVLWEQYKRNNFKLDNDPRMTRVGRVIRKLSLDELPNFVNVLHGEMSLVGPRPRYPFEVVAQAERFPHTQRDILRTLTVKPGVTGPWQVAGRSSIGYEQRTHLEARYAESYSLGSDLAICLKTIPTVLRKTGAH